MKFIEIKDGFSVRKDEICMVERLDTGGTRIYTEYTSQESIFPYETILKLLEVEKIEEQFSNLSAPVGNNMFGAQHWAG